MPRVDPWIDAPLRPVRLGSADCAVEAGAGGLRMRLREPLQAYPRRYTDRLVQWAERRPDRIFLGRRPPGGPTVGAWDSLNYRETLARVRAIGQALLDRGLSAARPVVILSENDFENQLLALACTHVGIPYVPVTPTFPLLGPLGLLPLPSKWIIEFGEPIATNELDSSAADDPMLVFNLTDQVREVIQQTLYKLLLGRRSVFF